MDIRRAGLADLKAVTAIEKACFDKERYPRQLLEFMLSEKDFTTLLAVDGRPIGSVTLYLRDGDGQIVSLGVLPEHRGRGVATALMDVAEDLAREGGAERVVLQVSVVNVPAMNFYLHRGYVLQGLLKDYYGRGQNAYLMDRPTSRTG